MLVRSLAVTLVVTAGLAAAPGDRFSQFDLTLPVSPGWSATSSDTTASTGEAAPAEAAPAQAAPKEWEKDAPVSIAMDYALMSDYVWRGINISDYAGEGAEKANHQLGGGFSLDLPWFTIGTYVWSTWFQDQNQVNSAQSDHLQEIDYVFYIGRDIEPISTNIELGWIAYTFPHLEGDGYGTYEVYGKISFDDSVIFGFPILSPYFYWGYDYDLGNNGSWLELGISHDFAGSDLGDIVIVKDLTLTPGIVFGYDMRYLHNFSLTGEGGASNHLANIVYSAALGFDLSSATGMSARYGTIGLGAVVNYSQAVRRDLLNDELYGGFTVAYAW